MVCDSDEPVCLYCRTNLDGARHEHDHFPIPERNGGTEVHCTCIGCHDRKDRYPLATRWNPTVAFLALNGLWSKATTDERLMIAKMVMLVSDSMRSATKK